MADPELTRKLVANLIPAVVAPASRVAINHHYDKKIMNRRHSHQMEMAERKADMMNSAFGPSPLQQQQQAESGLEAPTVEDSTPERVYGGLRSFRDRTECGFCHQAASSLLDQDLDTASRGLSELRQYEQLLDRARTGEMDPEEVEPAIFEMIQDEWEAVPQVMGGGVPA